MNREKLLYKPGFHSLNRYLEGAIDDGASVIEYGLGTNRAQSPTYQLNFHIVPNREEAEPTEEDKELEQLFKEKSLKAVGRTPIYDENGRYINAKLVGLCCEIFIPSIRELAQMGEGSEGQFYFDHPNGTNYLVKVTVRESRTYLDNQDSFLTLESIQRKIGFIREATERLAEQVSKKNVDRQKIKDSITNIDIHCRRIIDSLEYHIDPKPVDLTVPDGQTTPIYRLEIEKIN